jgi:uncharacterized membrane protein YeaQ/YmgE (transglycosylase-associated protein family)
MGLILSLIIGGVSGWLAGQIMKSKNGIIVNIILGIVGGGVGSFTLGAIGLGAVGIIGELVSATLGAVILIFIGRLLFR